MVKFSFSEKASKMRNHPYGFDIYLVNVKTIRTTAQIFVAFSEKLNFTIKLGAVYYSILNSFGQSSQYIRKIQIEMETVHRN